MKITAKEKQLILKRRKVLASKDEVNEIREKVGDAVEILYNLDSYLSNTFLGDGSKHDKAVKAIRKQLEKAMDAIHTKEIYPLLKEVQ